MRAAPPLPVRAPRATLLCVLALAAAVAFLTLGLDPRDLWPRGSGAETLRAFGGAALSPAFDYEVAPPPNSPNFALKVLEALRLTLVFAAAGMSLALSVGLLLGFATTRAWWVRGEHHPIAAPVHALLRGLIAVMRAVHELVWAILLLAALGLNSMSAVLAIAIPYAGTLAKVFGEMLDEADRDAARALQGTGASAAQVFLFGLLPRALPDMAAYAFYRLECAVRSAAILGFFGFPTLGYFLKLAFENKRYHEVWSYLWVLIAVVVALETWSGVLRRRVVMR